MKQEPCQKLCLRQKASDDSVTLNKTSPVKALLISPCVAGVIFIQKSSGASSYSVILGDTEKRVTNSYEVIKLVVGSKKLQVNT